MVHERSPATLHLPSRPSNRFKMAFRPRFGMFLHHHDPKSPYSPVNFVCIYPMEPKRLLVHHGSAALFAVLRCVRLGLVSPPIQLSSAVSPPFLSTRQLD